jgi:hypothetical protein
MKLSSQLLLLKIKKKVSFQANPDTSKTTTTTTSRYDPVREAAEKAAEDNRIEQEARNAR